MSNQKFILDNSVTHISSFVVRCASTADVNISSVTVLDGQTLNDGDLVLLHKQTNMSENGVYLFGSGALVRDIGMDQDSHFVIGTVVIVTSGTLYGNALFVLIFGTDLGSNKLFRTYVVEDNQSLNVQKIYGEFLNMNKTTDEASFYTQLILNVQGTTSLDNFIGMNIHSDNGVTATNYTGINIQNDMAVTTMQGLTFNHGGTCSSYSHGLDVNMFGTYANLAGLNINVNSATCTDANTKPVAISSQGALNCGGDFVTASNLGFDTYNNIGSGFQVLASSPIVETDVIGNLFAGLSLFSDDYTESTALGIGVVANGTVGQVGVLSGKTCSRYTMMMSGSGIHPSSTGGSITNFIVYESRGVLGSPTDLVIDRLYGFRHDNAFPTTSGDYGFYNAVTNSNNYFKKNLIIGSTDSLSSVDAGVELKEKTLLLSRVTTTARDAYTTPLDGMMVYNSTTDEFNMRQDGAWAIPQKKKITQIQNLNKVEVLGIGASSILIMNVQFPTDGTFMIDGSILCTEQTLTKYLFMKAIVNVNSGVLSAVYENFEMDNVSNYTIDYSTNNYRIHTSEESMSCSYIIDINVKTLIGNAVLT